MSEKNNFKVRLMRWGDSSSSGRTVTLKLPDDTDEHPFKGLPVGSKNGQLMEISVTILDGDDDLKTIAAPKKVLPHPLPTPPEVKAPGTDDAVTEDDSRRHAVISNVTRTRVRARGTEDKPAKSAVDEMPTAQHPPHQPAPRYQPRPEHSPLPSEIAPQWPTQQPPTPAIPSSTDMATGSSNDAHMGPSAAFGGADLEIYADQMGHAAEALAAVAERMEREDDDHRPHHRSPPTDEDDGESPGIKTVRRAVDLCRAIDKQRAGFFYFMRALYPEAPMSSGEGEDWSRDAKATRDRVCLHCETPALGALADDTDARKKFEELENNFERTERLR